MCVLPYAGKSSLDLRTRLRSKVEENTKFYKLNFVFRSTCRLGNSFRFKDSIEKKKFFLEYSTAIRGVTARLLITEKRSQIFLQEHLSTWKLRIKQENELQTLKSWQYLTTCYNVTFV